MKDANTKIFKKIVAFDTSLGCYADDIWVIPLQRDLSIEPEIHDNGVVENHHQPYIELSHGDNALPEVPGKKNPWRVKIMRVNEDNDCEIYGSGVFTSSRAAIASPLVQNALEKARLARQQNNVPMLNYIYS